MTTVMKNGAMVEIATVGDEGLIGINAYFGGQMLLKRNPIDSQQSPEERSSRVEVKRRRARHRTGRRPDLDVRSASHRLQCVQCVALRAGPLIGRRSG